jgi:hypothetical protein
MNDTVEVLQTRAQKAGWAILLVISGLLLFGGVSWFFSGPEVNVSYTAEVSGEMSMEEYVTLYPEAAKHLTRNARQVGVWFAAVGWMALIAAREGYRHATPRAWYATWALPTAFIAIGLIYTIGVGGLAFDNLGFGGIGVVALVGQLLARPR